jgi:starvation-inducible DNA-binding protein
VKDNDEEDLDAPTMLAELRDDTRALVETLKDVKALVDAAKDNATSGLVDTWTDEAERRAWFLEETLR